MRPRSIALSSRSMLRQTGLSGPRRIASANCGLHPLRVKSSREARRTASGECQARTNRRAVRSPTPSIARRRSQDSNTALVIRWPEEGPATSSEESTPTGWLKGCIRLSRTRATIFSRLRKNYCGTVEIQYPAHLRQARSVWSIWSIWFIWLVSSNQTNQIDRTDQMNKTGWRTFSASC